MKKTKTVKFKESVGIDIGTHSVKVVHLKKLHEGFKLLNYEIRPTVPVGVEYIPSDLRPDRFAPVIVEIMKTLHINPKKIQAPLKLRQVFPQAAVLQLSSLERQRKSVLPCLRAPCRPGPQMREPDLRV